MSKFLKVMIVLLTIVAVAAPVMAEDRLGLSGQMRVRGWYLDDGSDRDAAVDNYVDQRLRIGGKISVAEGVSITFRTDFSEQTWGTDSGVGRQGWQLDRAHLDIANDSFAFRAGQQNWVFGNATIDAQEVGATVTVKSAVPVTAFVSILDKNDVADDSDTVADEGESHSDNFLYAVQASHKGESYSSALFVGGQKVGAENVNVVGLTLAMDLGAIALDSELDFFTGDADDATDAMGTQLYVDAKMAATDAVSVGGRLYYAMAADTDGSEAQYTTIGNGFNGWDPANYGPLENESLFACCAPYDFTGDNAGVVGLQVYTNAAMSDAMAVSASLAYLMPEDDKLTDNGSGELINSQINLNLGMTYQLMANVEAAAQVQYVDVDADYDTDSQIGAGAALYVNF